ncbi:hypothetical protein MD484_g20, partial [Candolleomyces efflorescens]
MPPNVFSVFSKNVTTLHQLTKRLPTSVPLAPKDSRITTVFTNIPVPKDPLEHWEVFNRRMDALFSEDSRDKATGRLPNVQRGKHGLDLVLSYLDACITANSLQWEAAMPRIMRLIDELKALGATLPSKRKRAADSQLSDDDGEYAPPRRARDDDVDDLPDAIFDPDGHEVVEETGAMKELKTKRAKKKPRAEPAQRLSNDKEVIDLDSGDESDGRTALDAVHATDASRNEGARRGPINLSMQHFHDPEPVVEPKSGMKQWEFRCKHCSCVRRFKRTINGKDITFDMEPALPKLSNLATHTKDCKGLAAKSTASASTSNSASAPKSAGFHLKQSVELMERYLKEGELNPAITPTNKGFKRIFAAWILDEDLPWTTGEAPLLRQLFAYLKITHTLPSDTSVRNELAHIFADLHGKVVKEFASIKSKIAYATDTWTNRQMIYTFACTVASFIDDDWNLIERVIDFKPLESKEHEGYYAARAFIQARLDRPGTYLAISFLDYFIALATDNATVNDVIFQTAARYLLSLYNIPENPDRHIRCLAHVINLVVQAMMAALDEADPCDDFGDENDYFLLHKDAPVYYDVTEDQAQNELEGSRDADMVEGDDDDDEVDAALSALFREEVEEEVQAIGLSALKRLRFINNKITSSPQRRKLFWKISAEKYGARRVDDSNQNSPLLASLMPVRDVRTRWNSSHAMLTRSRLLREAINEWVFKQEEYQGLMLTPKDWEMLKALEDALQPFAEVTKLISSSSRPTLPFSLPIYFDLHAHLSTLTSQIGTTPIHIRTAAAAGLSKLNKYKAGAEQNHYLIISTGTSFSLSKPYLLKAHPVLHPSLRAEWFRKTVPSSSNPLRFQAAQDEAVDRVKLLVKTVAEQYQAEMDANNPLPTASSPVSTQPIHRADSISRLASICDVTASIPAAPPSLTAAQKLEDELSRYFGFEGAS